MRTTCARAITLVAIAVLASRGASAQSAAVTPGAIKAQNESALAVDLDRANRLCGTAITAAFDWTDVALIDLETAEPALAARHCGATMEALRSLCRTPASKGAVRAQIKAVACGFDSFDSKKPTLDFADGTLRYQIDLRLGYATRAYIGIARYLTDQLVVDGLTLAVRYAMESDDERLEPYLRATNEKCGSNLSARYDRTGLPLDMLKDGYASSHCERAIEGIQRVCEDAAGRKAVTKVVKTIVCHYKVPRSAELKDGVLDYYMDFTSFNDAITIFEYLQGKL
jgi:hypothetical protein